MSSIMVSFPKATHHHTHKFFNLLVHSTLIPEILLWLFLLISFKRGAGKEMIGIGLFRVYLFKIMKKKKLSRKTTLKVWLKNRPLSQIIAFGMKSSYCETRKCYSCNFSSTFVFTHSGVGFATSGRRWALVVVSCTKRSSKGLWSLQLL